MLMILFRHAAILALTIGSLWLFDANPRVLAFAYLFLLVIRLVSVHTLIRAQATGQPAGIARNLARFSRPPPPGSSPAVWRDENSGEPVGFGGYLIMSGIYALFAFILLHAGPDSNLAVHLPTLGLELGLAVLFAIAYGIEEFFGGAVILKPDAPDWENYAYNVGGRMILLHLSIFICGGLLAYYVQHDKDPNSWLFFGPVVALKHISDLFAEISSHRAQPKT